MSGPITAAALVAAFEQSARPGSGPAWLVARRRVAMARVAERGLPGPRDEDWKYTSLTPLLEVPFDLGAGDLDGVPSAAAVAPFVAGPASWTRLVFVNGRYAAKLSSIHPDARGVRIGSLAVAIETEPDALERHLAPPGDEGADAFADLNAASWVDGALVQVPDGAALAEPIQLLFVATAPGAAALSHPRTLIALGKGSRATVLESYAALDPDAYLVNAVSELALDAGAELDHVVVTAESPRAFHLGRLDARLAAGSRLRTCAAAFGGRLVRRAVRARLDGEDAACHLSGVAALAGQQHLDTRTVVDHLRPRCVSRQLFKNVLDGRSRAVFSGRVVVHRGADGTDAHQTNKNLLLSDDVEADSKPQLEIFADDVKCSHGASDGQIAEDAVFYLKSRGLDEAAARTLLTRGFAREVLDRIGSEPVREWCDARLSTVLREGRVVEGGAHA